MARDVALSFRIEPEMKAALERAAQADERSVSQMVERILKAWLVEKGYLSAPTSAARDTGVEGLNLRPIAGPDHPMFGRDRSDK